MPPAVPVLQTLSLTVQVPGSTENVSSPSLEQENSIVQNVSLGLIAQVPGSTENVSSPSLEQENSIVQNDSASINNHACSNDNSSFSTEDLKKLKQKQRLQKLRQSNKRKVIHCKYVHHKKGNSLPNGSAPIDLPPNFTLRRMTPFLDHEREAKKAHLRENNQKIANLIRDMHYIHPDFDAVYIGLSGLYGMPQHAKTAGRVETLLKKTGNADLWLQLTQIMNPSIKTTLISDGEEEDLLSVPGNDYSLRFNDATLPENPTYTDAIDRLKMATSHLIRPLYKTYIPTKTWNLKKYDPSMKHIDCIEELKKLFHSDSPVKADQIWRRLKSFRQTKQFTNLHLVYFMQSLDLLAKIQKIPFGLPKTLFNGDPLQKSKTSSQTIHASVEVSQELSEPNVDNNFENNHTIDNPGIQTKNV